ncbi:hypothetical protein ABT336_09935 [Micromonospora sp. NPDC000207]|uniref:hypothetical protein n=1 Tax=Micromonospora sp. NPDC000207 TaxID=3154246 RepID=UPI0033305E41
MTATESLHVDAADPLYVAARRVLLDALEALDDHLGAVILVGAQAIYLQVGEADLEITVAPFTTDADLGIDPGRLGADPRIAEAMTEAGFTLKEKNSGGIEPGTWIATTQVDHLQVPVPVDLLVPEAFAPLRGKRDARLPDHGKNATRWTPGLEPCLFDNTERTIASLEPDQDMRTATIRVAGPGALLVAKAHKLAERLADEQRDKPHRVKAKDAGDVVRLMRSPTPPDAVGARLANIAQDKLAGPSVIQGVQRLEKLFGTGRSRGVELAVTSLAGALDEDFIRELAPGYIASLMDAYRGFRTTSTSDVQGKGQGLDRG